MADLPSNMELRRKHNHDEVTANIYESDDEDNNNEHTDYKR